MECRLLNNRSHLRSISLQTRRGNLLATGILGVVWIAAVALGLRVLLKYESTPGPALRDVVPKQWPSASEIQRSTDRPTLVMLAHPHCPCTRASMGELAQIMAGLQGKVNAYVLFLKPKAAGADWEDTGLRRSAAAIPGVTGLSDVDGLQARRFGVVTSGHTLLFDRNGHLQFSGGITQSRGHAGGNAGATAIVSLVNNQPADRTETFVFGCSLANRSEPGENAVCLK